jgi:hypothetical protein
MTVGFRQCARCKKELPEAVTAEPREQWAKDLLARLR